MNGSDDGWKPVQTGLVDMGFNHFYDDADLSPTFLLSDLANGGSDRFIDAMCLWGDADDVRRGLRAHFDAGATHVCLQPVHEEGNTAARDKIIETLADV